MCLPSSGGSAEDPSRHSSPLQPGPHGVELFQTYHTGLLLPSPAFQTPGGRITWKPPLTLSGSGPGRCWSSPPTSPSRSRLPSPLGSTLLLTFPSCYLLMSDLVGSQVARDLSPQVLLLLGGGFPRSDIAPGPARTFGPRMHKGRTDRLWGYQQPSGSIRVATVGPQTNCLAPPALAPASWEELSNKRW